MANCQSETINKAKQARTCAALMDVFQDAHDAYEAAVERGDADREAVTDARSEALVAFLTGPRPKNTAEAHQVIFAAMQAVVDGNDFDVSWRSTVCPALTMLGVRSAGRLAPVLDDTCIAVCRDFIAKHVAMDASPGPDIPEPISDAADEAWERVKRQRPVTVAGFAAILRSYVMWVGDGDFTHDDPDMNAMFKAVKGLCDLVGFDEGQALVEPESVPIMRPIDLDEFRRQLAGAQAIVEALAIATEMGAVEEMPQETLWRTLHASSDMVRDCIVQFDSDAFEAAWRGKAVRS
jgi:hypothetical protein